MQQVPFHKQPKSIADLIAILVERGLQVDVQEHAEKLLESIHYNRLSGYLLPFELPANQNGRSHRIKSGTSLQDVLNWYAFDKKLRSHIFEATEQIEIGLRAQFVETLMMHTKNAHVHLDAQHFSSAHYQKNLQTLQDELNRSKDLQVKHYIQTYFPPATPPLWTCAEVLSFGTLSKWVTSLSVTPAVQNKIASHFGFNSTRFFLSFLICLTTIRNICAHHARLADRIFSKKTSLNNAPTSLSQYLVSDAALDWRLYNMLVVVSYTMSIIAPADRWKEKLASLLHEQISCQYDDNVARSLYARMGFPPTWQKMAFWK